ncbi:LPS assembly protein LptD [uncultured Thiodictyon sp.]|uniref:LPS-assembly protein LptD n=1 Tax=uncultured Thiodictyon sp. TaxID=1846217 RepID=UPI0025F8741A|nr:LPS assembly protein LptD [uncultured Thiodictyon sp.]
MAYPPAPLYITNLTIVRPFAVALILSLAAPTATLAERAAADAAAPARPGPAPVPTSAVTPAAPTVPETAAVPAPPTVPVPPATPAAPEVPAAPAAPPAASGVGEAPAPAGTPPKERKTEPNTLPVVTTGDTPLALPVIPEPTPQGATVGAPAVPDPIPPREPTVSTPVDLPLSSALPAGAQAQGRPVPDRPAVAAPTRPDGTGSGSCGVPPPGETRPAAAPGPRTAAPLQNVDESRLYVGLPWNHCGAQTRPGRRAQPTAGLNQLAPPTLDSTLPVAADANCADYDQVTQIVRLSGGVKMTQGNQHLEADRSSYDQKSGATKAVGNVYFEYPGTRLLAKTADINLVTKQGKLDDVHYRLSGATNLRGTATTAQLLAGNISHYKDVIYTSCPPGRSDWSLRASELELDQQEGLGTARHARLRFGPVPVFYTPYLQFPIDSRRRSGVLMPSVGYSTNNGVDITVPYYWNIAPNLDATFFPRIMSMRGPMLGAQVRGLTKNQKFELDGAVLPHDDKAPQLGTRWDIHLTQSGAMGRWATGINYNAVSDSTFITDFGNNLDITSLVNLTQTASLAYYGTGYYALAWVQQFQTVDPRITGAGRPYAQRPHLQLVVPPRKWGPVEYTFDGQYDYFENTAKTYGSRGVLLPSARLPLRRSFGHLIPRVRLYATAYELANTGPNVSKQQSFLIPNLDVDGGLVFDRNTNWFGKAVLQTLEPRLYYVYTPYANQSTTPLFDTSPLTFSYSSLFRPNRFTGYDRISDENRLTVGLTSRTLGGRDGREWLRASLGEIFYFDSRRVQATGTAPDTTPRSALAGELATNPIAGLTARASFQWGPNRTTRNEWEQQVFQLSYAPSGDRLFNLAYRYSLGATTPETYKNTDVSFRMPIGSNISVVGRWLYSLLQNNTVEAFGGIEYGGRCCWRLRILGRQLKTSATSSGTTSIMLELELAGLGSIGDKIDNLLEQRIYGYGDDSN